MIVLLQIKKSWSHIYSYGLLLGQNKSKMKKAISLYCIYLAILPSPKQLKSLTQNINLKNYLR